MRGSAPALRSQGPPSTVPRAFRLGSVPTASRLGAAVAGEELSLLEIVLRYASCDGLSLRILCDTRSVYPKSQALMGCTQALAVCERRFGRDGHRNDSGAVGCTEQGHGWCR